MSDTAIPGRPEDVTAQWLEIALGSSGKQVSIDAVTVEPIGTGQTGATYRVSAVYGADPGDLPSTFVVKLPSQDPDVRARAALGYRAEHAFYTEVADTVRVPMPRCYHCEIGSDGAEFILLLADMAPAVQGDQMTGCSAGDAELAARALAGLHGPRWCDPAWGSFTGAVMPKADAAFAGGLGDIVKMATGITLEKFGDRLADADQQTLRQAAEVMTPWLLLAPGRFSVLHGDFRLDNLLFDPDHQRISVVDWQTLAIGLPARDLAYFIATGLDPELRADEERALVDSYHQGLLEHGVTGYDRETAWLDYRLGMLQVPLIATTASAFVESTPRGDDVMVLMIQRSCRAIRELGTLELIDTETVL